MTIAVTTFTRFDAIGVREQLSDAIYMISPVATPFMQNAKVGKAKNTLFEWQTDALAAAVSTNQQLEGDTISTFYFEKGTPRWGRFEHLSGEEAFWQLFLHEHRSGTFSFSNETKVGENWGVLDRRGKGSKP